MNKTLRNILIVITIIIATTLTVISIIRLTNKPQQEPQQGFAYWATIEEELKRDLASQTLAINQQIAVFNDIKRDLQQEINYAKEQKDLLRVQDVPLAFH